MDPNLAGTIERIAALRREVTATDEVSEALQARAEDLLIEGYAHALAGDAWLRSTEQQLHDLINDRGVAIRGDRLREISRQHVEFQRCLVALRRELAGLRHDSDQRATSTAARSA